MDKRYTVFVSSTFKDLVEARWAVARALMRLNLIPLGMENFTASDKRSRLRLTPLLDPARRAELGQFMTPAGVAQSPPDMTLRLYNL